MFFGTKFLRKNFNETLKEIEGQLRTRNFGFDRSLNRRKKFREKASTHRLFAILLRDPDHLEDLGEVSAECREREVAKIGENRRKKTKLLLLRGVTFPRSAKDK